MSLSNDATTNSNKRRRVSDERLTADEGPTPVPSAIVSGVVVGNATALTPLEPELDDIATLLLVELQKSDRDDVFEALDKLKGIIINANGFYVAEKVGEVRDQGGITIIILAMKRWRKDPAIQTMCCNCLAALTIDSGVARVAIAKAGGVEEIVNAIRYYPSDYNLQAAGFAALSNFFTTSTTASPTETAVARRFVEVFNGIDIAIKTMKAFPGQANLQLRCCTLLYNLAVKKDYHDRLVQSGAIGAVAVTAEQHYENADVKKWAKKLLSRMLS